MFKRSSGVLRARDLAAPAARRRHDGQDGLRIIDFLADAHQTYWQVLPLGHTGFGDSPYQCFSAAAGNPYLIDMDLLVEYGLLTADEVRSGDFNASPDVADFEQLADTRWPLFRKAYSRVTPEMKAAIADFTEENREWLPGLRAVHGAQGGEISPRAGLYVAGEGRPRPQAWRRSHE